MRQGKETRREERQVNTTGHETMRDEKRREERQDDT